MFDLKRLRDLVGVAALLGVLLPGAAMAQSGCASIVDRAVLTAGQWNACFAGKQNALGYLPVNKSGDTMLGPLGTFASTTLKSGLNVPPGTAPTSPLNGDMWSTSAGFFVRVNGVTIGPLSGSTSSSFAATLPLAVTFPSGVTTFALNYDSNFSLVSTSLAWATGGISYASPTGGAKGAGTVNLSGNYYVNGTPIAPAVNGASGTILQSTGAATAPSYTTATYPATTTINHILYSSAANAVAGLATANGGILNAGATGVPSMTVTPLIGVPGASMGTIRLSGSTSGSATITPQAISGSPTITIPNASGTIAVSATTPVVLSATTGALTCPTCVTSSGGGAVTGVAPVAVSAAGAVSITGAAGQVLAGSGPAFTASPTLGVAGSAVGSLAFANLTSGSVTLQPATGALGSTVLTMPAFTDTLVVLAGAQAITGKTYNGLTVSTTTGSLAISNGKTVTNTATTTFAGVDGKTLTVNNGGTLAGGDAWTLAIAAAKTLTVSNSITMAGTDATVMTFPTTSATIARTDAGQTFAGSNIFSGAVSVTNTLGVTSASATAFAVGLNGATNPAFQVDASTASSATGIKIKSAAAAGGVSVSVITSGTNENLAIDAAGSGTITLGGTSTGAIVHTRATTLSAALTYGGVTFANTVTGSGSLVGATAPTVSALTVTGSFTATGLVTNAALANPSTTVNGQTCTLGSTCTITATAASITVGTTLVSSGTTGRVLFDSAGTLGEYQITGTAGSVVMSSAPSIVGGSITALTALAVRDTSAAFDLTIAATSSTPLSAGRTLTFDVVNAARTVKLGANLTIATDPGAVTGALKSNASGTFAQAACADLSNGATGCSTAVGTSGATLPLLNAANTWAGVQTFTNSTIALLGSSTGKTTFTAANAGASNFTITVPAVTGNLITSADTGTVTNAMLANSSVTVGTTAIALGASSTTIAGLTAVTATAAGKFNFAAQSAILSPSDGILLFQNNALTDFTRLQFGGTTSSFPALKRTTTALNIRLADDSADATITFKTQSPGDNTTNGATTQFVTAAVAAATAGVSQFNGLTGVVTTNFVVQTFCASGCTTTIANGGTGTYAPTAGALHATLECVAGGGGGAGQTGPGAGAAESASGGGAGSRSWSLLPIATIGASQTVSIGAAGTAGASGSNAGGNGGDSSFGTLVIAKGGTGGGSSGGLSPGGAGGVAGTGQIKAPGAPGGNGQYFHTGSVNPFSGQGASGPYGSGGTSAIGNATAVNGNAGTGFGSGGSGGSVQATASNATGGAGTGGFCIAIDIVNL